jgi:hypothetical protein
MRRRWQYRRVGSAFPLSKPTAHADSVPADPPEVGRALSEFQSNADETESRTLVEPANTGASRPSRTDIGAIGDDESLAVTNPRGDPHDQDPDSDCLGTDGDCSAEPVDCHPVGDDQPIADCKPIALTVTGGRACRNRRTHLASVGAGGLLGCSRGSDAPSRARTPSTALEG